MKCAFIYNPHSGKCKQEKRINYIIKRLKEKYESVEVFPTQYAGHATTLAREACGKFDFLVGAGGDGTLSEIINGLAEEENRPPLGYVPSGTVNDVGRSLRLPHNLKKLLSAILEQKTIHHDLFKVNGKYGIYVCCAGVFTETSYSTKQSSKKALGKIAYAFHALKKMFTTKTMNLKLTFDGGEIATKAGFFAFLNSRSLSSIKTNRHAKLDDGQIDVVIVKEEKEKVRLRTAIKVLLTTLFGINSFKSNLRLRVDKAKVETGDDVIINIDGEKAGTGAFELEVKKQHLEIVVGDKFKK